MKTIKIKAPAKVNTLLRVVGRRPNGYHDLQMVMVPLTLADEVELTEAPSGIELEIDGERDPGMLGEKNLAWRAASILSEAAGLKGAGARISLKKVTPVAAGLGGGSSDAAAVLKGLNLLWNLNFSADHLAEIGAKLGADVPFFCYDSPAFVEGIGDRISPIDKFPKLSLLLINPGFAVPTPWVYKQWDLQLTPNMADARFRPLFKGFGDVIASLHNDLEAVTSPAYPEIEKMKRALIEKGAAGALMSGSGPTVFGVFEDAGLRDGAAREIVGDGWRVFRADAVVE